MTSTPAPMDAPPPPSAADAIDLKIGGVHPIALMAVAFGLLVLVLVWRWLWRRRQERATGHIAGEVVGVVGRPGSGKTLFAVRYAAERLRAGGTVCTNFTMSVPPSWPGKWVQYRGWSQLITLQDCVVILDEAHLEAPSSTAGGASIPKEAAWYLSQVRRMGVSLIWVSQNEMRVAKTLRDLTNYIWVCNSFRRGKSFKSTQYEPENLRKPEKHLEIRRWKADPELWPLFDSWEILMPGDDESEISRLAEQRNARRSSEPTEGPGGRTGPQAPSAVPAPRLAPSVRPENRQVTKSRVVDGS